MTRGVVVSALAVVLFAAPIRAQYFRSRISGFVQDTTGAVVPGASVVLEASAVALKRTTTTDNSGFYVFSDLPGGQYEVSVEAHGFKKFTKIGIALDSAASLAVDAALEVGDVTQSVEVTAGLEQVQIGSTEVSRTLTSVQLSELPIPGRNLLSLSLLLPGVIARNGIIEDRSTSYSFGGWFIMGLRKHFNYMTIDGLSNMQNSTLILYSNIPSPDFTQEFKVSTSAYSAEYGRSVGVQMNVVTKSGTRNFHGDLFEFVRNDKLRARGAFEGKKPPYRFNDYGWTIGGPVYIPGKWNKDRNKLFFFVGQEFHSVRSPASRVGIVPTAEEKAGNFSHSSLPVPKDPATKLPFPGNIIPAGLISPNGQAMANIFPLPNYTGPGGNFYTAVSAPADRSTTMTRLDYLISSKWNLSLRNIYDNNVQTDPIVTFGGAIPLQGSTSENPAFNGQVQLLTLINPSTVNEVLLGVSSFRSRAYPYPQFATRSHYSVTYPNVLAANVGDMIPNLSVSPFTPMSVAGPAGAGKPSWHYRDNFSKTVGRHSLKFGAYVELGAIHNWAVGGVNGSFSVSGGSTFSWETGNALADLLTGHASSYSQNGLTPYDDYRYRNYEFYAQDSWKVRSNLTVEYGLRYSIWPPYYSQYNALPAWSANYFDPAKVPQMNPDGSIVAGTGSLYNGVILPGCNFTSDANGRLPQVGDPTVQSLFHCLPRGISTTNYGGLGPRLGISWDPLGTGKMALRAGIGLVQGRSDLEAITVGLADWPPFVPPTISISNAPVDNPSAGVPAQSLLFPQNFRVADFHYKNPSVVNWHFSIQKELPGQIIADIGYVGNQGSHESRGRAINFLTPEQSKALFAQIGPGKDTRPYLPYKGLGSLFSAEPSDSSSYESAQVRVSRRFNRGFLLNVSYTLSKSIGGAQDRWDGAQDPLNAKGDRGYNEDDRRHVLVISAIYELPFFKSLKGAPGVVLKGWEITTVADFNSGRHFTPGLTAAANQVAIRPDLISSPFLSKSDKALFHYFNTAAFARPAQWIYGNAGRNILVGPGTNNFDVLLAKNTKFQDRFNVQFRCEMFNFFNHPSYSGMNTTFGSSAFGQVNGVNPGRTFQLGMKFLF